MRYKEATIYEDFIARIFNPTTSNFKDSSNCVSHLAAALIDTNTKYNSKGNYKIVISKAIVEKYIADAEHLAYTYTVRRCFVSLLVFSRVLQIVYTSINVSYLHSFQIFLMGLTIFPNPLIYKTRLFSPLEKIEK